MIRGVWRPVCVAAVAALNAGLLISGCARAVAPEGGPVPETPLRVASATPDTFATVEGFGGAVEIEFNRRISERPAQGSLRDAVVVSPRSGEVSVQHRRSGLRISMEGGFEESTIYRITVLPVLQDLFRNRMEEPFDLFFSTGPEFEPNVLAGLVTDRLTRAAAPGVRVHAQPYQGGPVQSTVSDSAGIFTFPFLPQGRYNLVAFEDQNRNREADFSEPQDSTQADLFRGDTLLVMDLTLLLPDSTPAFFERVEIIDSVTLRLGFDDPFDADFPLDELRIFLSREGANAPEVIERYHAHEWAALQAERADAADPGDDLELPPGADPPLPTPPDPRADPEADSPGAQQDAALPLPAREFVIVLSRPLIPEAAYTVTVEGLVNLSGITGGGGTRDLEVPPPAANPSPPGEP